MDSSPRKALIRRSSIEEKNKNGSRATHPSVHGSRNKTNRGYDFVELDDEDSVELLSASAHAGKFGIFRKKSRGYILLGDDTTPPTSAQRLISLAKPKTFVGPEVKVQNKIVKVLEKRIQKEITEKLKAEGKDPKDQKRRTNKESDYASARFIGAIELTASPDDKLAKLISNAKLVNLPASLNELGRAKLGSDKVLGHALTDASSSFDLIRGLEKDIVRNTLSTMQEAGQIDYLRESGLINEDWKVIIEVHYYRDRDTAMTGTHKDTLGQTLFVNLNFQNDKEAAGPEYIINPTTSDEYDQYVAGNLPKTFVDDLNIVRKKLGKPDSFGASRIPQYGVVAFTDEIVHHKTPMLKHRTISIHEIKKIYSDIVLAYEQYMGNQHKNQSFTDFLNPKYHDKAQEWFEVMTRIEKKGPDFNQMELAKILPQSDIKALFEEQWYNDFSAARIAGFHKGSVDGKGPASRMAMTKPSRPLLQRQMSQDLLAGNAPDPVNGRRTFFRTWVRVVPTLGNRDHTVDVNEIVKKYPEVKAAYDKYERQQGGYKSFADYLPGENKALADHWYDIMSKSNTNNARYYNAALDPSIRNNLK